MTMRSIDETNKTYLCIGCGACRVICPNNAIQMESKEIFYPQVDESKCAYCGKCIDVCPGISSCVKSMAEKLYPTGRRDVNLGRFRVTYLGYSNDYEIRFNSASGGVATSLICGLLNKRIIDGAILTRMNHDNPLRAESFIAQSREDVISAQNSKYCPTTPLGVLRELKDGCFGRKFAFVGLPCQIQGLRKLQEREEWLREKIIITIGLLCSHSITIDGTKVILSKFNKDFSNVEELRYRGGGWPGGLSVKYRNGNRFDIPLNDYWPSLLAPYFFTPYRCLTCNDFAAELADISLGDAWLKEVIEKDDTGTSLIIVRSSMAEELLSLVREDGEITLEAIPHEKVIEAQQGILARKKIGVGARIKVLKILHKPIPQYDQEFNSSFSGYFGATLSIFNAFISRTIFGQKLLKCVPKRILKVYSGVTLKYSGK